MSVVIKRDHPAGTVGVSVASFPSDKTVILGIGPLDDMHFFGLNAREAIEVSDAIEDATLEAVGSEEFLRLSQASFVNAINGR